MQDISITEPVLDIYGREIKEGQWISYPVSYGSSLYVKHAKVTGVSRDPENPWIVTIRGLKPNGTKKIKINSYDRCMIAPEGWAPAGSVI